MNITKILGDPSDFNTYNYIGHQLNINEIRLHEETNLGDLLIVDLEQVKRGHVVKFTPVHMKKAALILEVRENRFILNINNYYTKYIISIRLFFF